MKKHMPPEVVFLHCSTTKRSYEILLTPEQLSASVEYRKICVQMERIEKKHPNIRVILNAK